jgi:hypothetical protein
MKPNCLRPGYRVGYLIFTAAIFLFLTPAIQADSDSDSGFTMTVDEVRLLSLDQDSVYLTPDVKALMDGKTESVDLTANVWSNAYWALTIRGSESEWEGPWPKPVGDILWRNGPNGEFTPLDTEPVTIAEGGPVNNEAFDLTFSVKLDMAKDVPGEYSYSSVILELTAE